MSSSYPTNVVFERALKKYIGDRLELDKFKFLEPTSTPGDTFKEVEKLTKEYYKDKPMCRFIARFAKVIEGFQGYFSAIDAFVSSNPLIAGLIWGGLRFIIQSVCNISAYFEKIVGVLEKISSKLRFYHDYATELYEDSEPVLKALEDVYGDILTILMTVKRTFVDRKNNNRSGFGIFLRGLNPFNPSLDETVSSFEQRAIDLGNEVNHADRLDAHKQKQQKLLDDFLKLLPYADCSEKHVRSQGVIRRDEDPGRWFLRRNEFAEWSSGDTSVSSGLLWVYGEPGKGKTILISTVIETIKSSYHGEATIAFFYCEHQDSEKRNLLKLLGTILHQIIRQNFKPPFPSTMARLLSRHLDNQSHTSLTICDLICEVVDNKKTFLVIDALDECDERTTLLPILERLSRCALLFISSRNEADIRTSFARCPVCYQIPILSNDIDDEIRRYIGAEMNSRLCTGLLVVRDQSLVEDIIEKLIAGADGMYLWVILQIEHICEQRTDKDIRDALNNLPRGLDKTFIRSLKKIDELAPQSQTRLKRVLQWVVCATSPLSLPCLMNAVAIDEMEETWDPQRVVTYGQSLVDDCAHLLVATTKRSSDVPEIQLIHASVFDFLTSNPERFCTTLPQYHVYPLWQAQKSIVWSCLRYISKFSNINQLSNFTGWRDPGSVFEYQEDRNEVRTYISISKTDQNHFFDPLAGFCTTQIVTELEDLQVHNPMFQIMTDPFPSAHELVVFPHATHVKAINCEFYRVHGSFFNCFLNPSDVDPRFGTPNFDSIFQGATHLTLEHCIEYRVHGDLLIVNHSLLSGTAKLSVTDRSANRVTVTGLTFISVHGDRLHALLSSSTIIKGDWEISQFPSDHNTSYIDTGKVRIHGNMTVTSRANSPTVYDDRYFLTTGV